MSCCSRCFLSPHGDKLFERHWIGYKAGDELIWRRAAAGEALHHWGITGAKLILPFSREQESFLSLHR